LLKDCVGILDETDVLAKGLTTDVGTLMRASTSSAIPFIEEHQPANNK